MAACAAESASGSGGCCWWRSFRSTASRKADAYSNQGSLLGMERFAKRHRKTLNELFAIHVAKPPSDSTFRLLLAQLDVEGFEALLQHWIAAQPGVVEAVDILVTGGKKTLRGSIDETASGAQRVMASGRLRP